jgi:hypothetical protein
MAWLLGLLTSRVVPFLSKGWERFLSIAIYLIVAGILIFMVLRPTTKTIQTGGVSNSYNVHPGLGGCVTIPFKK